LVLLVFLKLINKRLFKPRGVKLNPAVQTLVAQLDRLKIKRLERRYLGYIFATRDKSEHMRSTGDLQPQNSMGSGYESSRSNISNAQDPSGVELEYTRTVYSDASGLFAWDNERYISELANSLSSNLRSGQLDGTTLEQIFEILPELLKAFALKVGHSASTQMHRDVMFFVHEYRR
jgi:hypothetical protein